MARHPHGKIIHSVRDQFGLIQVVETADTRSLYFNSLVEQSRAYLYAPCTLAFEYQASLLEAILDFSNNAPVERVLMLGLGGGCLATQLHLLMPNCLQILVEQRAAVIEIAHQYFQLPNNEVILPIEADAGVFVKEWPDQAETAFDVIVIDLYDSDSMPFQFAQELFLSQLARLVSLQGCLLFNLWVSTPEKTKRVIRFWQNLPGVTLNIQTMKVTGNVILNVQFGQAKHRIAAKNPSRDK